MRECSQGGGVGLEEPDLEPDSTYTFNHYTFIALTLYCLDCYVSAQISLSCR